MKQAVIVIHGIGEQRPMDTLRGFADAILPDPTEEEEGPKFWSKPDRMSEIFELRKLTVPGSRTRPTTDLYEYYWAYQAQGTKFSHLFAWARALFFRWPWNVPRHLRFLWGLSWLLIVLGVSLSVTGRIHWQDSSGFHPASVVSALVWLLFLLIQGFVINYLGDAARYLDPQPENISFRREVRAAGIKLLRRLHRTNEYDRIVIVGHSLGSVIAYDILVHSWQDFYFRHDKPLHLNQEALNQVEHTGQAEHWNAAAVDAFRDKQLQLWHEQRKLGNPWRVTDLITIGSPLAHAELLLARSEGDLRLRQRQRELPTCPPEPDHKEYSHGVTYEIENQKRTIRVLNDGAMFACTRWTNIYFPASLGLFGDLVGGKLSTVFGVGVKDTAVSSSLWLGLKQFTPLIHTCYWQKKDGGAVSSGRRRSLRAVIDALELDSKSWLTHKDRTSQAAEEEAKGSSNAT